MASKGQVNNASFDPQAIRHPVYRHQCPVFINRPRRVGPVTGSAVFIELAAIPYGNDTPPALGQEPALEHHLEPAHAVMYRVEDNVSMLRYGRPDTARVMGLF